MDVPTVLLRDLARLGADIEPDHDELAAGLIALMEDLRSAVPSATGVRLSLLLGGRPIDLAFFVPARLDGSTATSLRLRLRVLGPDFDPASRVVLYAGVPGAFVDLAADLGYLLRTRPVIGPPTARLAGFDGPSSYDGDGHLMLDADLPPVTATSGLTGLAELSVINRAIGVLIERGRNRTGPTPPWSNGPRTRASSCTSTRPHCCRTDRLTARSGRYIGGAVFAAGLMPKSPCHLVRRELHR